MTNSQCFTCKKNSKCAAQDLFDTVEVCGEHDYDHTTCSKCGAKTRGYSQTEKGADRKFYCGRRVVNSVEVEPCTNTEAATQQS